MSNNPNKPQEFDAVLGGKAPPPVEGVILGGLEGVKHRLTSTVVEARVTALSDALNYGEAGLDLVIGALNDSSQQVQRSASRLLRNKGGDIDKQALLKYDPWTFFTTFQDWKVEHFNPQIGITDPAGIAYIVKIEQLKLLLQDPQASKVEALICEMWDYGVRYEVSNQFYAFVDILFDARQELTKLRALYIRDGEASGYNKSYIGLGDISFILDGYPNLEVLQLQGYCEYLECSLSHNNLKTLIIETLEISDKAIDQIYSIQLPALEYFELWMGKYSVDLDPVLFGEQFPNLSYLGLRGDANRLASKIAQSPIVDRLAVLDLSMCELTDEEVKALLNCPAINQLHTLNIAYNLVSTSIIQQLPQLNCQVIAEPQEEVYDEVCSSWRYQALYE